MHTPPPNQPFALIADDDANARAILSAVVGEVGLATVEAEDGRQALEALTDLAPNVILLDVHMPRLSGIEVCWWIRRQRHLASAPVILLSDRASQVEIDAGLLAGANHYLTKPFTRTQIAALVAQQLRPRPLLPPPTRIVIADPPD